VKGFLSLIIAIVVAGVWWTMAILIDLPTGLIGLGAIGIGYFVLLKFQGKL